MMHVPTPHQLGDPNIRNNKSIPTHISVSWNGSIAGSSSKSRSNQSGSRSSGRSTDSTQPSSKHLNASTKAMSSRRGRRLKKDISTSERAKHHLHRHGAEENGRDFSFLPKTISLDEARCVVGNAYAGTDEKGGNEITHWLMDPLKLGPEEASEVFRCAVGHPIQDALSSAGGGGVLFGIKEEAALSGCLIFREHDPEKEGKHRLLKEFINLLSHGCPYIRKMKSANKIKLLVDRSERQRVGSFMARAEHLEETLSNWHRSYGPTDAHWYLSELAVEPTSRGKGYGREMMAALVHLADRYERKIYVECGGNVTAFFTKFGFQVVSDQRVDAKDGVGLHVKLMVRDSVK